MQRLIQRQFLRLRGWREHYTRRTMKRTGCSRSEVTVLDEDFAEFASAQYMSGPAQRVLVPYRGRTYMASLAFTSQQVFIAQLNLQWVPRRISDSNTHGIFRLFKYLFAVRHSCYLFFISGTGYLQIRPYGLQMVIFPVHAWQIQLAVPVQQGQPRAGQRERRTGSRRRSNSV